MQAPCTGSFSAGPRRPRELERPTKGGWQSRRKPSFRFTVSFSKGEWNLPAATRFSANAQRTASIFRTTQGMTMFPGQIPLRMKGRRVLQVRKPDPTEPADGRHGRVVKCRAVVRLKEKKGRPDYTRPLTLETDAAKVLQSHNLMTSAH